MSRFPPAILVYEKKPRWEAELKRRFSGSRGLVRPCRSVSDVLTLAAAMPGSILVLDFDSGIVDCLRILEQALVRRLTTWAIVLADRPTADLEWPARELGARGFLKSPISGDDLAQHCRRLWNQPASPAPPEEFSSDESLDLDADLEIKNSRVHSQVV